MKCLCNNNNQVNDEDIRPLLELDLSKCKEQKFQTVSGYQVRILAVDCGIDFPIVGLIQHEDGPIVCKWNKYGYVDYGVKDSLDLILIKQKRKGFINLYKTFPSFNMYVSQRIFNSPSEAEHFGRLPSNRAGYIGTIPIEWEE